MSPSAPVPSARTEGPFLSPWAHVARVAAALAAGMGVGRFVYTPILPLMHDRAGLSTGAGAHLATANYVGYLVGALAGTLSPALVRSRATLRGALVLLIGTLAAMPATQHTGVWLTLRLLAGVASALIFVVAVNSLLGHLRDHPPHLPGWGFGGVGAGIALSGLLVLALRPIADWRTAWWAAAALTVALTAASWNLRPEVAAATVSAPAVSAAPVSAAHMSTGPMSATHMSAERVPSGHTSTAHVSTDHVSSAHIPSGHGTPDHMSSAHMPEAATATVDRRFVALFVSYSLEGVGYIVAGTFLVAAIAQGSPGCGPASRTTRWRYDSRCRSRNGGPRPPTRAADQAGWARAGHGSRPTGGLSHPAGSTDRTHRRRPLFKRRSPPTGRGSWPRGGSADRCCCRAWRTSPGPPTARRRTVPPPRCP
ncbi:YbfB/YjiJ family MFS transporter [Streptomyces sp. MBT53]|uniref:YbfB/YjiJ family MFS transporter n=1 Tax=Streptomyces sp. MBT53 TaxID=1488384 RepID=UPI001F309FC5|nr:YbfB/YjiJ family MFS transporter [Streptomyces sp. MBT53]